MIIYALILDDKLRMLTTNSDEVYRIADDYEKCGGWSIRVEAIPDLFFENDIVEEYNL